MQVCPLSYLPKTPLKSFSGRLWKRRQNAFGEVPYTLSDWMNHSRNLHFFTKLTKSLDRWCIKAWMIGDSIITILSCNHPRTWKSKKPHRYKGKRVDKMLTYLNCNGIPCYRHGTCELYWHYSNSWSTTKYLATCLGWAKVKLGGLVGGHYCTFGTTNYNPK
jgi:hypothetical protein